MAAITALLSLASLATAQQIGAYNAEVHPKLTTFECTKAGGCTPQNTSVVIDAVYRWVHQVGGYNGCTTSSGTLNSTICPDAETCGKQCALEGVTYSSAGVTTNGTSVNLKQFVGGSGVSPRLYLLGEDGDYVGLKLVGKEISFTADVSQLPCGMNGALYLSNMPLDGGRNPVTNPAGPNYGTGYCDAQCPKGTWINGTANLANEGSCCTEMDLWEANSAANALTPHACNITGLSACTGDACGFNGTCDQWGCGFNAYGQGNQYFYGPNLTVDTTRPFTVVTQFVTDDNTTTGNLESIKRFYVQDGKIHEQPTSKTSGLNNNDISTAFCTAEGAGAAGYLSRGGNSAIAKALNYGMVLIFSIWDDAGGYMTWLDSGSAGPCSSDSGVPATILADYPNTQVTWSDVKWGELGSTYTTTA